MSLASSWCSSSAAGLGAATFAPDWLIAVPPVLGAIPAVAVKEVSAKVVENNKEIHLVMFLSRYILGMDVAAPGGVDCFWLELLMRIRIFLLSVKRVPGRDVAMGEQVAVCVFQPAAMILRLKADLFVV